MIRCPNCNEEITAGRKFCGHCGTKLPPVPAFDDEAPTRLEPPLAVPKEPVPAPAPARSVVPQVSSPPDLELRQPAHSGRKNPLLTWGGVGLGLIALLALIWVLIGPRQPTWIPTPTAEIISTEAPTSTPVIVGFLSWSIENSSGEIVESGETTVYPSDIQSGKWWNSTVSKQIYTYKVNLNKKFSLVNSMAELDQKIAWDPNDPGGFHIVVEDNGEPTGFNWFKMQSAESATDGWQGFSTLAGNLYFQTKINDVTQGWGISLMRCETDVRLESYVAGNNVNEKPDWVIILRKGSYLNWY